VLKQIACPQSQVNGWAGFVLTPSMFSLINPKPFDLKLLNLPNTTGVPKFPPIYAMDYTTIVPYTCEQMLSITATFTYQNYYDTVCNIYRAVYNTLNAHINNAFKVAPPTTPPPIGWNASMLLNDIFNQMMKMYGRPMPNTMHQNMMTFCPHQSSRSSGNSFQMLRRLSRSCHHCQRQILQ
jgi:hypothetical protein